ncbi:MAG: methionyl-tRNA formyltransferase [Bacteroidales bacterium]|nr:methionyl-tRNA formyltransferase [Bacteroidales bacterium]
MTKKELRIIYMGTPEFAVAPLQSLVEQGFNIVAVITMPDKPQGRGRKISGSPVKEFAVEHNIPVLQPEKLKNPEFIEELKSYKADLQIVVAFRMLPEIVWNMPKYGTFNLHAALLPQYRGAAPINWAIINGETKTGVTTFLLDKDIDTGRILMRQEIEILDSDNIGTLYDKLMEIGQGLVVKTVEKIIAGDTNPIPQEELIDKQTVLKPAPKIFKEDCRLEFNKPCNSVRNLVRGLSPYPAAFTTLNVNGKTLTAKIFETSTEISNSKLEPGKILTDNKSYLKIVCNDGFLIINELQLEGKKRMKIQDFLRGVKIDC